MKKEQSSIVRQAIMELAAEDLYGLWELCWRVADLGIMEQDVVDAVQRELVYLVQEHKIAFYLRSGSEDDAMPVAADQVDWCSAVATRPPGAGEPQVLISIPDSAE